MPSRYALESAALRPRMVLLIPSLALALILSSGCTSPTSSPPAETKERIAAEPPWMRQPPPPDLPQDRRLNVAFLIVDGVYNTELTAPYDVFQHTIFHTDPGMETFTVSPDGGDVRTFEGLEVGAHYSFETAPSIDVLVVPSAEHSMDSDLDNEEMIAWVREVGAKAHFVLSLCDGAFVLAKAGLLDGHAATTFPGDLDRFAEVFPQIDLRRGVSFVHDGKAVTSAGGAQSFDAAMYLADHLYGEAVAEGIGRGLIIPWPPAPGTMKAVVVGQG